MIGETGLDWQGQRFWHPSLRGGFFPVMFLGSAAKSSRDHREGDGKGPGAERAGEDPTP